MGCPIRRSWDQSLFPAPPSLSQGITSFIASCCQGIHQTPFLRLIRPGKSKAPKGPPHRLESLHFPPTHAGSHARAWSVYLTWIALRLVPATHPKARTATGPPTLGQTSATLMCFSLHDVNRGRTRKSGWTRRPNPPEDDLDDLFPHVRCNPSRRRRANRKAIGGPKSEGSGGACRAEGARTERR